MSGQNITAFTVNSTVIVAPSIDKLKLAQFTLYIICSTSAMISSSVVFYTIFKKKTLHNKNYYIFAALAVCDFLRGLGYMMAGALRIIFMVNNSDGVLIPRGHCMFQMYQTAQMTGQLGSCTMVLAVAIDRLMAIAIFEQYRHFKERYAFTLIGIVYAETIGFCIAGWFIAFFSYPMDAKVKQLCRTEEATSYAFYLVQFAFRVIPGMFSIPIYCSALYMIKKSHGTGQHQSSTSYRRQVQLTTSISVVVVHTFVCNTIPFGYGFYVLWNNQATGFIYTNILPFVYSLSLVGAATNLAVYAFKCEKFRAAFKQQWAFLHPQKVEPSITFVASTIQSTAKSQILPNQNSDEK